MVEYLIDVVSGLIFISGMTLVLSTFLLIIVFISQLTHEDTFSPKQIKIIKLAFIISLILTILSPSTMTLRTICKTHIETTVNK